MKKTKIIQLGFVKEPIYESKIKITQYDTQNTKSVIKPIKKKEKLINKSMLQKYLSNSIFLV